MSHRPSQHVVAAALMGALLFGCGGGGGGGDSDETRRNGGDGSAGSTTTTTAAVNRIDLSQPIPGGSLHGTPRPPLENTGDDYVAIFESLDANFRWLAENPDPALISELYVPGTGDHDYWMPAFQELVANGWRAADDGYFVVAVEVSDARQGAVSLHVVDSMETEVIVDSEGARVGEVRARMPKVKTWNVLLSVDETGRWRFADWQRVDEEVEV